MANKILIVEDDRDIQMAFARMLSAAGFSIAIAGDAVSALSTAVQERPDAVILDLGLPAGNGTLVLERMRNLPLTAVTPVVVVSGRAPTFDEDEKLKQFGCENVLLKPVTAAQLVDTVSQVLGTAPMTNDAAELH